MTGVKFLAVDRRSTDSRWRCAISLGVFGVALFIASILGPTLRPPRSILVVLWPKLEAGQDLSPVERSRRSARSIVNRSAWIR